MMTLIEAWEFLGEKWKSPVVKAPDGWCVVYINTISGSFSDCLCDCVADLFYTDMVDHETKVKMKKAIKVELASMNTNPDEEGPVYLGTLDAKGAKIRSEFCFRMAKEEREKENGRQQPVENAETGQQTRTVSGVDYASEPYSEISGCEGHVRPKRRDS